MQPSKSKRRTTKRPGKRRGQTISSSINAVVTVPILDQPWTVTSGTSGTGGFTTLQGPGSLTSANTAEMNPFSLGARLYNLSGLFLEYKCTRMKLKYIPWTSSSGVVSTPTGATATPSYLSRPFVWGFVQDPAISTLTYATLRSFGGVFGQTDRPSTLVLKGSALNRWLYVSTTATNASPPSAIDYRMSVLGQLRWYFGDSSSVSGATHGVIEIDATYQFRYPAALSLAIGASLPPTLSTDKAGPSSEIDEKKQSNPNLKKPGWF
jgi:hypothetical protein